MSGAWNSSVVGGSPGRAVWLVVGSSMGAAGGVASAVYGSSGQGGLPTRRRGSGRGLVGRRGGRDRRRLLGGSGHGRGSFLGALARAEEARALLPSAFCACS